MRHTTLPHKTSHAAVAADALYERFDSRSVGGLVRRGRPPEQVATGSVTGLRLWRPSRRLRVVVRGGASARAPRDLRELHLVVREAQRCARAAAEVLGEHDDCGAREVHSRREPTRKGFLRVVAYRLSRVVRYLRRLLWKAARDRASYV